MPSWATQSPLGKFGMYKFQLLFESSCVIGVKHPERDSERYVFLKSDPIFVSGLNILLTKNGMI
jgi:hypothetical protein